MYATLQGYHPSEDEYTSHNWKQLNRFKKRRYTKTVNLLTGQTAASPEEVKVILILFTCVCCLTFPSLFIQMFKSLKDLHEIW